LGHEVPSHAGGKNDGRQEEKEGKEEKAGMTLPIWEVEFRFSLFIFY